MPPADGKRQHVGNARVHQEMNRFAVGWLVPRQTDHLTHVMLLDRDRPSPFMLAAGHGTDKVHALLNLWTTLKEGNEAAEAIDFIAAEYARRTGMRPEEPTA